MRGYWKHFEHIVEAVMPFIREHGHMPSQIEMAKLKMRSVWDAIRKYHGGYREVAKRIAVPTAQEHAVHRLRKWDAFVAEIMPMVNERDISQLMPSF
jgi:hypothetical protein